MKKKILPLMVSTREALELAARERPAVIYVERELYDRAPGAVRALLGGQDYVLSIRQARRGVFFLLCAGENRFRPEEQEIYDPAGIL